MPELFLLRLNMIKQRRRRLLWFSREVLWQALKLVSKRKWRRHLSPACLPPAPLHLRWLRLDQIFSAERFLRVFGSCSSSSRSSLTFYYPRAAAAKGNAKLAWGGAEVDVS